MVEKFTSKAGLIWNIAEILRGSWKQYEYQDVVLPLVVIKRLDALLSCTKATLLERHHALEGKVDTDPVLKAVAGVGFYNVSPYDFEKLLDDPAHIVQNFRHYLNGFSANIREIIAKFDFEKQLERLEGGNLLYLIIKELNKVDLHPDAVDNHEMGSIFEELIRRFAEQSNETAGEHYTPREVIKMMVEVLFAPDAKELKRPHVIKTIYDCACGTGGMLSVAKDYVRDAINKDATLFLFGQELNPTSYAMCKSDMLIKGENPDNIKGGDKDHSKASTLSSDQLFGQQFDYMLTNPPFGVDWKKDKEAVEREAERGFAGRFGAGLPRISDGQFLFLQHLLFKMRRAEDGGSRVAIVFNGSPLFTGDAGSGESEIRRWILEKDWLEAIIALPDQLFFNTGINTYVWILSNRKRPERKGKVQLVDARTFYEKRRKSLGNKRHEISDANRKSIVELYDAFEEGEFSKIFATTDFAYRQIIVERPLRLNFQASPERLARLKEDKHLTDQPGALAAIKSLDMTVYKNREAFLKDAAEALKKADIKLKAPALKALWQGLSERDETADVCMDANGDPEPDTDLRDTENVPWGTDVFAYFEKEVRPYAPDAWVDIMARDHKDGLIGKIGYEIPFTRYFYKYVPPRAPEEIEADIEKIENELQKLLKQI